MGQFWTKLVVIVHKIARFRTRKPNNTLSALKSIHRKNNNFGWSELQSSLLCYYKTLKQTGL